MIPFAAGLFIGASIGVLVMAALVASTTTDAEQRAHRYRAALVSIASASNPHADPMDVAANTLIVNEDVPHHTPVIQEGPTT